MQLYYGAGLIPQTAVSWDAVTADSTRRVLNDVL
jgi:hypothetical protein